MSDTKTCNLTEGELEELINYHGRNVKDDMIYHIERLGYLHKRLKAFKEVEVTVSTGILANKPNSSSDWGT